MSEIDLSEFLVGFTPKKAKAKPSPTTTPLAPQHIICRQCSGTGRRNSVEMHTPELSERAEELLTDMGKVLPIRQIVSEAVKCERCHGLGSHIQPQDVRNREVTMFWTEAKCACGMEYNGPAHTNSCMIRSDVYNPIIREGRLFGWRYFGSIYQPSEILPMHRTLPMRIETIRINIDACRKCIREQMVFLLPQPSAEEKDNAA